MVKATGVPNSTTLGQEGAQMEQRVDFDTVLALFWSLEGCFEPGGEGVLGEPKVDFDTILVRIPFGSLSDDFQTSLLVRWFTLSRDAQCARSAVSSSNIAGA